MPRPPSPQMALNGIAGGLFDLLGQSEIIPASDSNTSNKSPSRRIFSLLGYPSSIDFYALAPSELQRLAYRRPNFYT
ncbi:hypothetical protein FRC09_004981 [Ceratobasidium sp. 395]|nr:hypothetical protein FRC09_004981 [Ceratobasidium sp. 395]